MRRWQQAMIWLACSTAVRKFMQEGRWTTSLARRFVAGDDLGTALRKAAELGREGITASLYYLGEYVSSRELVESNVRALLGVLDSCDLPSASLSMDPTQVGYCVSDELGEENARRVGQRLQERRSVRFLMIDMEDSSYVERTIALHDRLREEGTPVAVTLQAYLRRTDEDVRRLGRQGAAIRLCKGAFIGPGDIAWTTRRQIDEAYLRCARALVSPEMREAGAYPIFATHDERSIRALIPELERNGWRRDQYEFEMLLGVRQSLGRQLARSGHQVRVYVPFGTEWWPYTVRRVGENPANARFVLRALVARG